MEISFVYLINIREHQISWSDNFHKLVISVNFPGSEIRIECESRLSLSISDIDL